MEYLHARTARPLRRRPGSSVSALPATMRKSRMLSVSATGFCREMGARLPSPHGWRRLMTSTTLYCDHLIVRDERKQRVVGTTASSPQNARRRRLLLREQIRSDAPAAPLRAARRNRPLCVHPDYRSGAIILLWAGLARYMIEGRHEHLIGCASVQHADGGHAAASLYNRLAEHMGPLEYRVFPRCPLPLASLRGDLPEVQQPPVPPLIKGYLRAGAWICGAPPWTPTSIHGGSAGAAADAPARCALCPPFHRSQD